MNRREWAVLALAAGLQGLPEHFYATVMRMMAEVSSGVPVSSDCGAVPWAQRDTIEKRCDGARLPYKAVLVGDTVPTAIRLMNVTGANARVEAQLLVWRARSRKSALGANTVSPLVMIDLPGGALKEIGIGASGSGRVVLADWYARLATIPGDEREAHAIVVHSDTARVRVMPVGTTGQSTGRGAETR